MDITERLLQLAQDLNPTSQDDLKIYLPFYYDETGSPKSEEELADFHLKQRWAMGRMSLSIFHPLKKEVTHANDSNSPIFKHI